MSENIIYEPDDVPPFRTTAGLALQFVATSLAGIMLTVVIVMRAGGAESHLAWATFAALLVSGASTALQAKRLWRIGAGYILLMGTSGAFIAACVLAIEQGGTELLASLVIASSLFQFGLARHLALLRRVITPVVAGIVIMLISVTVIPILFEMLPNVPESAPASAAPVITLVTFVVSIAFILLGRGKLRLWAPVLGVGVGCTVSVLYGIYDTERIANAPWIGLPAGGLPQFGLDLGTQFWALLPAFIFVTAVGAIETVGDSVAIQRVSWIDRRAPSFSAVQGAVNADGVGNLLSGLLATVPNTTYSSSVALVEITGVAARRVGIFIGALFAIFAFLPKFAAVILAVPDPVIGAYGVILLSLLFVIGAKIVVQDGLDYRKSVIVGVAFWVGAGFQAGAFFPELIPQQLSALFDNGMTSGGLVAILLTLVLEFSGSRPMRLDARLHPASVGLVQSFIERCATKRRWSEVLTNRLTQAIEETILLLVESRPEEEGLGERRMRLRVREERGRIEVELLAAAGKVNIEDRMAILPDQSQADPREHEMSLRILRHLATSVQHHKYHDLDVVTLRVEAPAATDMAA